MENKRQMLIKFGEWAERMLQDNSKENNELDADYEFFNSFRDAVEQYTEVTLPEFENYRSLYIAFCAGARAERANNETVE